VALIHRKDARHKAVVEWSRRAGPVRIVTTDEVLTEVLAFCSSDEGLRGDAAKIVRGILAGQAVRAMPHFEQEGFNALFR